MVEKTGRSRKGGAVKIDQKMREYLDFLYGRKWFEEVVLRKLWAEAKELAEFENAEEFSCRVAHTLDDAKELIEAGFEYVTDMNDTKLFRKRK